MSNDTKQISQVQSEKDPGPVPTRSLYALWYVKPGATWRCHCEQGTLIGLEKISRNFLNRGYRVAFVESKRTVVFDSADPIL